jgi:hypothetical protein
VPAARTKYVLEERYHDRAVAPFRAAGHVALQPRVEGLDLPCDLAGGEPRPDSPDEIEHAEGVDGVLERRRPGGRTAGKHRNHRRPELPARGTSKPSGITPTISTGWPSRLIVLPTMFGSPANRRTQLE